MKSCFLTILLCLGCSSWMLAQQFVMEEAFYHTKGKNNRIVYIYEDNYGFLWFGGYEGYYRYDGKDLDFINITTQPNTFFNHAVRDLYQFKNGNYWFAAGSKGLVIYDTQQQKFQQISSFNFQDSTYQLNIIDLAIDEDADYYFLSSEQGVWQVDKALQPVAHYHPTTTFGYFHESPNNINQIRKVVFQKEQNRLWFSGMSGLFSVDLEDNNFQKHPIIREENDDVKSKGEHMLINDFIIKNNKIYCGSWLSGLLVFDIDTKKWTAAAFQKEHKRKRGIEDIMPYDDSTWLIGHGVAIGGVWQEGNELFDTLRADARPFARTNQFFKDKNGYWWAAHWTKVAKYKDLDAVPAGQTAQIYVRSIWLDSIPQMTILSRWDGKNITIPKTNKTLEFEFRLINPLTYEGLEYEYRLENKDKAWIKNGDKETVVYQDLSAGNYVFQVRYWDKVSKQYIYSEAIKIKQEGADPLILYLTWGIIGISILSVMVFFLYRFIAKRRREKAIEKYEKELREVQDAALRSQMNPHFLFNSLNSIRYFIVTNDNKKAANYLTKFSRLIRLILENSKKKLVSLEEELELLRLYVKMEQVRFENKFDFKIQLSTSIHPRSVLIPPMLIQPYIENAIIHGINPKEGKGQIVLDFQKSDTHYVISVTDDGIGRKASQQQKSQSVFKKQSLGMNITQSRLDLTNTKTHQSSLKIIDLYDSQNQALGTKVIIQLPISVG